MPPSVQAHRSTLTQAPSRMGSPVLRACAPLEQGTLRRLLRQDPSGVHDRTPEGQTPMMLLAQAGLAGATAFTWMKDLVPAARWQQDQDHQGRTVLHHAAQCGNANVVRELLKNPWSIDQEDQQGNTALHLATGRGHAAVVEQLVRAGASADRLNRAGDSPRTLAGTAPCDDQDRRACVAALGETRLDPGTLLFDAVCSLDGDEDAIVDQIRRALDHGASPNDADEEIPALHHAAHNGHLKAVRLLLDRGAALHARDDQGNTALHLVMATLALPDRPAQAAVTAWLLDEGADVRLRNDHGIAAVDIIREALRQRPDIPGLRELVDRCTAQEMRAARAELEAVMPSTPKVPSTPSPARARL